MGLTDKQKYGIITLYEAKYSTREIAKELKINRKAVMRWINRYIDTGSIDRKSGSGRKRKTTKKQDNVIIKELQKNNNMLTATEIKNKIKNKKIIVSKNTIINRLHEYGYIYKIPISKPLMTDKHKEARLQ